MDALTTLTIISPVKVGVTICVFLFNAMYLLDTKFLYDLCSCRTRSDPASFDLFS